MGEEGGGHLGEGDEGGRAHEGHEAEEGGGHLGEGDEGGRAYEGHEAEEGGEHLRQGDEGGGGAHEGHEVSWTSGPVLCAPACASSCVWVSPHSCRAVAACVTSVRPSLN